MVLIWLGVCGILAAAGLADGGPELRGDLAGLLPAEHRARPDEPWLLLEPQDGTSADDLLSAGIAVTQTLGAERVPLAAPAGEVGSWLDSHAMYLVPPQDHPKLAEQLTEPSLTAAVDGLKARLSSPFFGVSGLDVRRDPLGLRALRKLPNTVGGGWPGAPQATATGDLLANDGSALLIQLRSERDPDAILADVRASVGSDAIHATVVGPTAQEKRAKDRVSGRWQNLFILTFAGLTVVLAVAMRRIRPALAILTCLASVGGAALSLAPQLGFLTVPLLALALGFGCEGALHLTRISSRGWPPAAILGTCLLPLMISNYPIWRAWAPVWLGLVGITIVVLRLVLPAVLQLVRGSVRWPDRGFLLVPMPALALAVSIGLLGGGAWAAQKLRYQGADALRLSGADPSEARVRNAFFDPNRIVEAVSTGETAAAALERASSDARQLASLIPEVAVGLESPGLLVLPAAELKRRKVSLAELNLAERMLRLREILQSRGFRPDAFGEFLSTAADLGHVPTAQAALDGPLGPWIDRYVDAHAGGARVRNRVFLGADPAVRVPTLSLESGRKLRLVGPVVATREDRHSFRDWLGIFSVSQLWLGALFVWLGTRQLSIAMAAAFAGLTTESALILAMLALGMPMGPALAPAFLLTGAAAMVAAARSCRSIDLREPTAPGGPLFVGAAQIVTGLALVASGEPLWVQMGATVSIGAAFAWGVGLFVAPGMCSMLRRLGRPVHP